MTDIDTGGDLPGEEAPALWEQQPSETSRQFATFRLYRDLHQLERSLARVGRELGVSTTYVERLSSQWRWVDRVAAWDREQDRVGRAQHARDIDEMNRRHAAIAALALQKITQRLETIDPSALKPSDVARLLEIASKTERIAFGASSEQSPEKRDVADVPDPNQIRALLKEEGFL